MSRNLSKTPLQPLEQGKRSFPCKALEDNRSFEEIMQARRARLLENFSYRDYRPINTKGANSLMVADENAPHTFGFFMPGGRMRGSEKMVLFDLSSMQCYHTFLVCRAGKEKHVQEYMENNGSLSPNVQELLFKCGYLVQICGDPRDAAWRRDVEMLGGNRVAVFTMNRKSKAERIDLARCVYVRLDASAANNEPAEKYVENALRAALADL